jgi:peptide/nickel transport system ATP-binding protein/oligopeptide transport system ATP-binding protein
VEQILEGDLPSPIGEITGCAFRSRCPLAHDACRTMLPVLTETEQGHRVMCTLHGTPSA